MRGEGDRLLNHISIAILAVLSLKSEIRLEVLNEVKTK